MNRSLLGELKRRNVLKATLLYVGIVWALSQGAAQLLPVFDAPVWVVRWFIVAALFGFPFWVAGAWFFELTPEGLKLERDVEPSESIAHETGRRLDFAIIGVLSVAIIFLLTDRFVLRRGVNQPAEVPEHSIAVLPFVNRSEDKSQEFFSDGISEDMLNLLSKVHDLKVISRSSSFSFKGKAVSLPEIAKVLGVAYVLEGSVQREGKTLRISAQLIDARSDHNVWSETYDRSFDDVFAIQDDIAGAVVGQLKLKLLGQAQAIDPDAYASFLQTRQMARQNSRAGYEEAIPLVQQVLAKAPGYAPAWSMLAAIYMNQSGLGVRPVSETVRLSREAIDKALAADQNYASAHSNLGYLATNFTGDLPEAAKHFERALALDPASPVILSEAATLADTLARLDLAIALGKAAIALDPVNPIVRLNLGTCFLHARRSEEAIASYRTALRLSPGFVGGHSILGLALLQKGDAEAALAEVQREPEEVGRLLALPIVYHALGRSVESDATLAELIAKYEKDAAYDIASIVAYRGEVDRAFEWLDKALAYHYALSDIAIEPLFDNLRHDPRWLPFLRRIGKAPEQLEKIEFKVMLPQADGGTASGQANR